MDSGVMQALVPLAAAGVSAWSPRYGGAAVQGGIGAMRAMNDRKMDNMRLSELQKKQQNEADTRAQISKYFEQGDSGVDAEGSSGYGGGGVSGNAPAANMALQNNTLETTGQPTRPGSRVDPQFNQVLSLLARVDPEAALRMRAQALASQKPPEAQKPERHFTDFVNPDNQKVTNVLEFGPGGQTRETSYIAGDMAKPEKDLTGDAGGFAEAKAKDPTLTWLKYKGMLANATREPKEPKAAPIPGELPPTANRRVDNISRQFGQEPVVRNTQLMAEAVKFADTLNPNTTNPADDQALIYAFAKAMDPNSVVREGEYAVVQKYAQSWADKIGFDAKRIFSNSQFLTPQARENMKQTIRAKYAAGKAMYDNLAASYIDRLNKVPGVTNGADFLVDYAGAFPDQGGVQTQTPPAPAGGVVTMKDGTSWKKVNGQWQQVKQ